MHKDVFRFQIAMDNIIFMHILNSIADLFDNLPRLFLHKLPLILLGTLKEVSIETRLQKEIDILLIHERMVEFDNIRMI
jgi:hypothetical protein